MPESAPHLPSTAAINLRRLLLLRVIALAGAFLTVVFAVTRLNLGLPVAPLLLTLAALALASVLTLWRLRLAWPVRDGELFAHLLLDVTVLTVLLYLSGGSTNPFVMLYLLPLALAASALPARYVWVMAGVTTACYSLLQFWHLPLLRGAHVHDSDFGLHVLGMWFGFVLSAGLIAGFAVRMNATLRERERDLAALRENALRQERVVALGTFATGAAHELGTPLSTLAVLIKDIEPERGVSAETLAILRTQIARCKEILASLSTAAGQTRAEAGQRQALDAFVRELVERWQALRPEVRAAVRLAGVQPAPRIVAEQTLAQAITNILNNAADVSPASVEIDGHWTHDELSLDIADRGPGLTPELRAVAGQPFRTTKGEGLGLGLFLAYTTFNRFGGEVQLHNRESGGVRCRLTLPLTALRVTD